MSTVSVSNIKNASSSVNNAVTTSGGDLTNAAGVSFMGGSKNLLYNGACQIAQRSTSVASISTLGYYTADRWFTQIGSLGTWTQSVENDAPTGSGLRKSLKMLCTTANASPSAGAYVQIQQSLEGQDLQRIAKGTASAQQLTLSFWVKSNVTGTYIIRLFDQDNSRNVSATYTISASATWEKKTITFPADTTGALDNDNAESFRVIFGLGAGSDYTSGTLNTTWASLVNANVAVGQTNLAAATNNYWQVTGVQLEVGPVATSFEFKSYGQELRECQRYYYRHASGYAAPIANMAYYTTTFILGTVHFPVTMRTAPSLAASSATNEFSLDRNGSNDFFNSVTLGPVSSTSARLDNNTDVSGTAGMAGVAVINGVTGHVSFSAEL